MWAGGPIVITGSERSGSFEVTGRYSADDTLYMEVGARSYGMQAVSRSQ